MKIEEWFKTKKYPHIGCPITIKDYDRVKEYVNDRQKVSEHSFLPLIQKSIVTRRFRADANSSAKNPSGKRKRVLQEPKVREVYFASHLDSLVMSKYNAIVSDYYEKFLTDKPYNESIVAYRKIPISKGSKNNKCNIEFAHSAFNFINNNKPKKLTAIVADITSFFDNLDHNLLKKQWTRVLGEERLPRDHFNIYKYLTRIKYVKEKALFESCDKTMWVEVGVPNSSTKKTEKQLEIKNSRYFRDKKAIAYCTKEVFLKNKLHLVISKNNKKGIAQGTPISATLANIYMLDFDESLHKYISSIGGFYQRYSDDLIVICEQHHEDHVINLLRDSIENLVELEIQPTKTSVYRYEDRQREYKCFKIDRDTGTYDPNRVLEYLGFTYDGNKILIKTSGMSKFYRSMKKSFKKSSSLALNSKNPDKNIFKSGLYKRFTYRGAKRRMIYVQSEEDKTKYIRTNRYYWGNYISYINKSNSVMKSINEDDSIKRQSRRFWKKFHDLLKFHEPIR